LISCILRATAFATVAVSSGTSEDLEEGLEDWEEEFELFLPSWGNARPSEEDEEDDELEEIISEVFIVTCQSMLWMLHPQVILFSFQKLEDEGKKKGSQHLKKLRNLEPTVFFSLFLSAFIIYKQTEEIH
jgi:hypothetical protein